MDPFDIIFVIGLTSFASFIGTALSLPFMMYFALALIKFALLFNVVSALLCIIFGALMSSISIAIAGFLFFAFSAYYAYNVWARIPFAASNLCTAVTAVRCHFGGLTFLAYSSLVMLVAWTLW